MDDLETELVDTIVRIVRTRRLRQSQLRDLRTLLGQNKDGTELQRRLDESKAFLRQLQSKRKELRTRLLHSRASQR